MDSDYTVKGDGGFMESSLRRASHKGIAWCKRPF